VFGPVHDALPSLEHWLAESVVVEDAAHHSALLEWGLMALSVALALGAIFLATRKFRTARYEGEPMLGLLGPFLHRLFLRKYFVDEIYGLAFVNGAAKGGGRGLARFDLRVIDAAVNWCGRLTRMSSNLTKFLDKWVVDGLVNFVGYGVKFASYPVRMFQTGLVQNYALWLLLGLGMVAAYFFFTVT